MLFSTIALFAGAAMAAPAMVSERQVILCTSGQAQCCATDVLGLADLNCASPPTTPTSTNNFIDICSAIGQQAKCCAIPILGQALICSSVNPTAPA
ncbi:fungal hydrophobin-domain-containing protein [Clohesyomyces aquaticus]|uniref:Fungal hydrophobin-domain-containing protein n=1 Tax=Clohesyomyces aquaticus TaxID=1231657 RepID=A0A1Y2A0N2_9PLEO|nr:fungal hydrophobin-domain-containing protein [Clohesyomyces aquaticus]